MKGIFWLTLIIKFKYVTTIKFSELIFCQKIPFINYITHMAYCPEFNPIENVNSMIRNNVRYNKNKTINDIENVLQEFKNKNHKKEFQNIYNSTFRRLKS